MFKRKKIIYNLVDMEVGYSEKREIKKVVIGSLLFIIVLIILGSL